MRNDIESSGNIIMMYVQVKVKFKQIVYSPRSFCVSYRNTMFIFSLFLSYLVCGMQP